MTNRKKIEKGRKLRF